MKTPILIFCDAVSAPSGLARIARDLASRLVANCSDIVDVATIGYGGSGSAKLPWTQYSWQYNDSWEIHDLPEVWGDFAGDRKGVFFSIQDPSRMLWFARPKEICADRRVAKFLINPPFERWGYFPVDASGPNGKLSYVLGECLKGYNRVLAYSSWSEKIFLNTLGVSKAEDVDLQSIPHGIDTSVFYPRGKKHRQMFGQLAMNIPLSVRDDELLVGIIATNQARKDYGLAVQICAELVKKHKLRVWIHTDSIDRHWQLSYLFQDFDLAGMRNKNREHIISTSQIPDESMAKLYSSCDVTLGIGRSEGFGYPIFESLACGTPCIHGNDGGAPEHMPKEFIVEPKLFQMECNWNSMRPIFSVKDWVDKIESAIGKQTTLPEHLDWNVLWPLWEKWFRKGIERVREKTSVGGGNVQVGGMADVLGVMETAGPGQRN